MKQYVVIAASLAVSGVIGWSVYQNTVIKVLRSEVALQERSLAALKAQADNARVARDVERARADKWQIRAQQMNKAVEAFFNGEIPDETLDPDIADFINRLRDN